MTDPADELSTLFAAVRVGDSDARNRLLATLYDRIVRLTAVMLRSFPEVARRREAESVAGDLSLKLIAALDAGVDAANATEFFRLAAVRLRGLLIDEAEKYRRRGPMIPLQGDDSGQAGHDPGTSTLNPAHLAQWSEFHRQVDRLPEPERDVFQMHYFLGQSQADIATVLGVEPKTVSRRWLTACDKLAAHLPS